MLDRPLVRRGKNEGIEVKESDPRSYARCESMVGAYADGTCAPGITSLRFVTRHGDVAVDSVRMHSYGRTVRGAWLLRKTVPESCES